jgi:Tfp pilus assembly protein PilW
VAFTIVELMIAVAIGTIVLASMMGSYLFLIRSFVSISNHADMNAQGRFAMGMFAADIRSARSVSSANPSNLVAVIPTGFNATGVVTNSKTITYSTTGTALYRSDTGDGTTQMLATNLTQVLFAFSGAGGVTTISSNATAVQLSLAFRQHANNLVQDETCVSARVLMANHNAK